MQTAVREAINRLNDVLALADAIGKALDIAACDDHSSSSWVFVYRRQIEAISMASSDLEVLLSMGEI